jgi:hypothetical protein
MPLTVTCSSCKTALNVGDHLAGKKVKCPKCAQVVAVAGPKPAAAAPTHSPTAARTVADSTTPAATISVTCQGCKKKLQAKAALAGKAVKCPGCGQAVRIPAAPAPAPPPAAAPPPPPPAPAPAANGDDEWMDVNEAAAPPPAATGAGPAAPGGQGAELLDPLEIPEQMSEQIRGELAANERIVWADRPQQEMLMHHAHQFRKIAAILGGAVGLGLPALGIVFLLFLKTVIPLIFFIIFGLIFIAVGVYGWGEPERRRKAAPKRACYVLTNRRALLHPGLVARALFGRNAAAEASLGAGAGARVLSFSGLELGRMSRSESKKFEDCGSLCFNRDLLDRPLGVGFSSITGVREIEKKIRQQLLDPIIDKILRGEKLDDDKGDDKANKGGEETELEAPDENIKDYVRGGKSAAEANDPNLKDARTSVAGSVEQATPEQRQEVEAELTSGERIVWIGAPEGKTKGRGLIGALTGAEHRYEPDYYLYAITNRRVMLFAEKGSKDSQSAMFGGGSSDTQGPTTYYPPHLLGAGLEQDNRIPGGGGILFKKVKRVIQTESSSTGYRRGAGGHRGRMIRTRTTKTSTRIEMHHFGILRVRNYQAVAVLLYETLIAPIRKR